MELPAMDDADLEYYTHSFKMGGQTYRNYSFGWSREDYTALWVAYPLCKKYTSGNVGRSEDWNFDPLLGALWSPAPFDGYAGSYDRGHQVPSADRQCCYEANAQTYYGTNIVPQSNSHNTGIWQNLETKVRTIANNSDTTYVVTGVMIADTKQYTTDSTKDKDKVTRPKSELKTLPVPTHFFKALLRYSKSSTLGQWNAAAFYLEHRSYSENIGKQHSMSIDELEEITGIDFFVNLPAAVGEEQAAKIEAADPAQSSVWW
jgi:endonuclease G